MHYKITNQTPLSFVTLNEAKRQLNIVDNTDDDIHINDILNTSMELAEKATRRKLSPCTVNLLLKGVYSLYLPCGEVESITSVKSGETDISYMFNPISQQLTIDQTSVTDDTEIIVIYNAGYLTPQVVPHAIKMGVKMLISTLFENREDSVVGMSVSDIPLSSLTLFNSCKLEYTL